MQSIQNPREPEHFREQHDHLNLPDRPSQRENVSRTPLDATQRTGAMVDLSSINLGELYRVMCQWGEGAISDLLNGPAIDTLLTSMDEGLSRAFLPTEWAGRAHLQQLMECGWQTQLFFDRDAQPVGGAIFLDRTTKASDETPILLRYIGFLYVAPEAQGKGAGRTLVDVLSHLETPDIILADVINPFSICPKLDHPAHVEPDSAARTSLWREQFGQIMDPHGRLTFWRKQGFLSPILDGGRDSPQLAPFPPIPLDCRNQPVPPEDGEHTYCCLVRPTSAQGWNLFGSNATAQEWENLYRALYPEDTSIDRTSLQSFERLLGERQRSLSLWELSERADNHRLLLDLSEQVLEGPEHTSSTIRRSPPENFGTL